jgi:hypothetical protein
MVNNYKAENPIPAYDSDFNKNLEKAGDKFLENRVTLTNILLTDIATIV